MPAAGNPCSFSHRGRCLNNWCPAGCRRHSASAVPCWPERERERDQTAAALAQHRTRSRLSPSCRICWALAPRLPLPQSARPAFAFPGHSHAEGASERAAAAPAPQQPRAFSPPPFTPPGSRGPEEAPRMARGGGCLGQPRLRRRLLLLLGGLLCLPGWPPGAAAPQGRAGRGQPPTPCQAPLQWEGRTVAYDHSSGRNTRAAVSYDGPGQRLRLLEERKGLIPCKKFFEYIFLYKDAVMFQIEQVTKLCSKIALTEPWDPYDIPNNSTYEDQYYIGGPGDEIMVQEWSDRKPARKWHSRYQNSPRLYKHTPLKSWRQTYWRTTEAALLFL
ncbi:mammalian ependymin-related protein 1 isoform X2 [Caretta caretta]|uniref:mammalian ependymin-related protein 1 isoform X2 n=1 Tax=Caretta caretta TaxID=8467 RepID=UPI0020944593|nr:mammalian ependymin-related protein 1 isoform X2 [Caretta caretta]